jgi:hypothetical protein
MSGFEIFPGTMRAALPARALARPVSGSRPERTQLGSDPPPCVRACDSRTMCVVSVRRPPPLSFACTQVQGDSPWVDEATGRPRLGTQLLAAAGPLRPTADSRSRLPKVVLFLLRLWAVRLLVLVLSANAKRKRYTEGQRQSDEVRSTSRDARRWHHQRWTDEMFLRFPRSTRALPADFRTFSNSRMCRRFLF